MSRLLRHLRARGTERPAWHRRVRSTLALVVLAVAALALLPARFGGHAAFVVVQGTSMEPTYHTGDLLYVLDTGSFHAGAVAVYEIPDGEPGAGHHIVHRLTRRIVTPGGAVTWELQGDNRSTPDATHPATGDLVGRPRLNLGPMGTRLVLVSPLLLALIPAFLIARAMWPDDEEPADEEPGQEPDEGPGADADEGPGADADEGPGADADETHRVTTAV